MKKILTLCIIHDDSKILLGMKKRGFGEGKWNGFGGKVEQGEGIENAALREFYKEVGVKISEIRKHGVLDFKFVNQEEVMEVHVFKGFNLLGEPQETEEMRPNWFDLNNIPFKDMWPDDEHWLPLFLENKFFKGEFLFDSLNNIVDKDLIEVERF